MGSGAFDEVWPLAKAAGQPRTRIRYFSGSVAESGLMINPLFAFAGIRLLQRR